MELIEEKRSETHYMLSMVKDCGGYPGDSYFKRDLVYTSSDGLVHLTRKGEILLRILEGDYYGIKEETCTARGEDTHPNPETSA